MASNPPDISHAGEFITRMDIKDILDCQRGANEVATAGVDDALGLSGRTRGLKRDKRQAESVLMI